MSRSRLLVALASVFTGLTVLVAMLGFANNPAAFVLAVPFGVVAFILWYHATGRLDARIRRRVRTAGTERTKTETGGFGAGPRERRTGPRNGRRGFSGTRQRRATQKQRTVPNTAEAYRTLGLDPGADETAIRTAYRERVKEVHPDTEKGNERAFKRVQDAYERLSR